MERKRLLKRDRILDCAMVLLAESGLEGVTIQGIADAMDLTVGALYRYFPSKSAILGALTHRTLSDLGSALKAATIGLDTAHERLLHIAETNISFCRANPAHFLLISQMMTSPRIVLPPSERPDAMVPAFALIEFLETEIRTAQAEQSIQLGDSRAFALMYWSAIQGALQLDKFGRLDPKEMHRDNLPMRVAKDLLSAWSHHVD